MTQEIQVTITLEVDVTLQKADIEYVIQNQLSEWLVKIDSIKEESEIYETENTKLGIYWSIADFEEQAKKNFDELKKDNPKEFEHLNNWEQLYDKSKFAHELERMISGHDATIGITWHTVEEYLGNCEIR